MLQAEIKNGSAFPVARHSESRGTITAIHGGTKPLYMSHRSIKNARSELADVPADEYVVHCKYRHFLKRYGVFQRQISFQTGFPTVVALLSTG